MKLQIVSKDMEKKGQLDMPPQFSEDLRKDIIKRTVLSEQANKRQAYGASPKAGLRHSTFVSKRRHDYRGTYGIGQSRTPRKILSRSGERMNWVGAFVPQTVGGRRAHPPKAEKVWTRKVNTKEKCLALRSAMAATLSKELAEQRGHTVPKDYPFMIDNSIDSIKKTKDLLIILKKAGFEKDLKRAQEKKVRAGRGKSRGRKYKTKKSLLIVTEKECPLTKSAKNIPGIDVISVDKLDAETLAPGAVPGRLTLWTDSAVKKLEKEKLYI